MVKSRLLIVLALCLTVLALLLSGCGKEETTEDDNEGRPEWVTAYQAYEYTKPAADKWQEKNWVIQIRSGDPDGLSREGKSRIWEVYYFSPRPDLYSQMMVIYNRGNVWPNAPGRNRGGEDGLEVYRENEPENFTVDSPEAYNVARRNGGGEFLDTHPDAEVDAVLRCRADYEAVQAETPSTKYEWIWDVSFSEPRVEAETLHVLVDGTNGDFIATEVN